MHRSTSYVSFLQALNVVNAVLDLYRDSLSLRPLLAKAEAELEGSDLSVEIIDDELPARPVDHVTIRLQQGVFVMVAHGSTTSKFDWRVSRSELHHIAKNPRYYLDAPERLNLDWLKDRVRLTTSPADVLGGHASTTAGH